MADRLIRIENQTGKIEERKLTPVEQTRSLAPPYVNFSRDDLDMPLNSLKDLYFQILDDYRNDAHPEQIEDQELFLAKLTESEISDDELREHMGSFILMAVENTKSHYNDVTRLAYFDSIRSRIISAVNKAQETYGERPSIKVVCFDVNKLHERNQEFGKQEANKAYRALAEKLVGAANKSMVGYKDSFSNPPGRVYLCRVRGTGDEVFAIFVNAENESNAFIQEISEQGFWPHLTLTDKKGAEREIDFTARFEVLGVDRTRISADTPDIGIVLKQMMDTTESIIDNTGHKRSEE